MPESSRPRLTRFFHPIVRSSALGKKPLKVTLWGEEIALFRDAQGVPAAVLERCPHRFAPLSAGHVDKEGLLVCPYHGWRFGRDGRGVVPGVPCDRQTRKTRHFQVVCRHDYLWLADSDVPIGSFPDPASDGYSICGAFTLTFDVPLHVVMHNVSEDEHLPFVHKTFGWGEKDVKDIFFRVESDAEEVRVQYKGRQRSWPGMQFQFQFAGDLMHNSWVTRFDPFRTAYSLDWTSGDETRLRPLRLRPVLFFVPVSETRTQLHTFVGATFRDPRLNRLLKLIGPGVTWAARREFLRDAALIHQMKDIPKDFRGMSLGRYDKVLVENQKRIDSIYFGQGPSSAVPAQSPGSAAVVP